MVMTMSGALAGLAGAGEITGTSGFLSPGVFVSVGFDSIAIALLARANPFAIVPAAILWGSLLAGAPLMQQETGISIDIVRIVQALVLLFVAADVIVRTIFQIKTQDRRRVRRAATQHRLGSDVMTASAVPVRRGIPRLGRLQTIGLLFGVLGIMLVGYVAPNLEPADKAFTFEPPPDPASISFDPRTIVIAFGIFFVITTVVCLLGPRYERYARACVLISTILFAPLIVILSLALSEAGDTNVIQLLVESLRLGTPIALGAMAGLVVRAIGRRQHRDRGHDAGRGRRRLHDLRRPRRRAGHGLALDLDRRRGAHRRPHRRAARARFGHVPRRPDHLRRRDQPARARASRASCGRR